jgi:hypothetical protein
MYAKLANNWGHYNPNRKLPTRAQGDTVSPRPTGIRSKGTIDLASVIHRQVSMASPTLLRLLDRLYLELKHEGDNWNLYKGDLLLFSSTNSREVLDWLLQVYVTGLLATGTVPPPPPEDLEKAWRRRVRANQEANRLHKRARR